MSIKTGITAETFEEIVLDAGELRLNYVDEDNTGILIGATAPGSVFKIEPEYHSAGLDGEPGFTKGGTRIAKAKASLAARVIEFVPWLFTLAFPGSVTTEEQSYNRIGRALSLLLSTYNASIVLIVQIGNADKPMVFGLKNALSESGIDLSLSAEEEAAIGLTFTGHYDESAVSLEPWFIRYPKTGITITIDFTYENIGGNAFQFTPIITPVVPVDEYDWDFGDGSAHSNEESPIHNYTS
jgi:hypothetical protein